MREGRLYWERQDQKRQIGALTDQATSKPAPAKALLMVVFDCQLSTVFFIASNVPCAFRNMSKGAFGVVTV